MCHLYVRGCPVAYASQFTKSNLLHEGEFVDIGATSRIMRGL
jgi:hypothetical protein